MHLNGTPSIAAKNSVLDSKVMIRTTVLARDLPKYYTGADYLNAFVEKAMRGPADRFIVARDYERLKERQKNEEETAPSPSDSTPPALEPFTEYPYEDFPHGDFSREDFPYLDFPEEKDETS